MKDHSWIDSGQFFSCMIGIIFLLKTLVESTRIISYVLKENTVMLTDLALLTAFFIAAIMFTIIAFNYEAFAKHETHTTNA